MASVAEDHIFIFCRKCSQRGKEQQASLSIHGARVLQNLIPTCECSTGSVELTRRKSGTDTKNLASINRGVMYQIHHVHSLRLTTRARSFDHQLVPNKGKGGGRRATCQWTKVFGVAFLLLPVINDYKSTHKHHRWASLAPRAIKESCSDLCTTARNAILRQSGKDQWTGEPQLVGLAFLVSYTGIMGMYVGWSLAPRVASNTTHWHLTMRWLSGGH